MPVVTPSRASIETVKAVPSRASLCSVIGRRPSSSARSSVRHRQTSPRACVAMKLIASGVANCAAITRSPSFSRSGSSTTTTIRPSRMSSIASSTVAKVVVAAITDRLALQEFLDVLREHVGFEVDLVARLELAERGRLERVRHERDRESPLVEARDRQARPLDGDRALVDRVAEQLGRGVEPDALAIAFSLGAADGADALHMP